MTLKRSLPCILVLALAAWSGHATDRPTTFSAEQLAFYDKQVLPILQEHCYKCHAEKKVRGNLRLDSRSAILKGGDLGPAVVPGKPDASPLVKALHYKGELQM